MKYRFQAHLTICSHYRDTEKQISCNVIIRRLQERQKGRGQLKCDGTRAETRFRLSAIRTSPFKSAGAPFQSTTSSRGVRISGCNAGYTMFRGSVKSTGYPLHSPVSPSIPLPCSTCAITFKLGSTHSIHQFPLHFPSLRHRVPSHFSWGLPTPFASFPFTSPPVRHRVPSRFNWSLPTPFASFPFTSRPVRHRVSSHFNWSLRPKLKCAVDLCNVVD